MTTASMGPRREMARKFPEWVRLVPEEVCFNGAAPGNGAEIPDRGSGAISMTLLQWGRAGKWRGNAFACPVECRTAASFNGAAPGNGAEIIYAEGEGNVYPVLQWGRAGKWRGNTDPTTGQVRVTPLQWGRAGKWRGNRRGARRSGCAGSSFNGAAPGNGAEIWEELD